MVKQDILFRLIGFLGPLGPLEEVSDREQLEEAWAMAADSDAVESLLDLTIHPPQPDELGRVTTAEFETELSHVLGLIGARDPENFIARVGPLLRIPTARPTIIEIIGATGAPEGLAWIAPLVDASDLTDDEATRLACSIGEIGGAGAEALLERLRARTPADRLRTIEEIEIAQGALRLRGASR
jgi:hypothetical protein